MKTSNIRVMITLDGVPMDRFIGTPVTKKGKEVGKITAVRQVAETTFEATVKLNEGIEIKPLTMDTPHAIIMLDGSY